ncbi:MAG: hypothetical protein MUF49_01680 [Oculatellaceae cyanobacterium Prado106]|nr:hypothetical protein [Oculatellaceae cyanobacterium Prado106]
MSGAVGAAGADGVGESVSFVDAAAGVGVADRFSPVSVSGISAGQCPYPSAVSGLY